MVPNLILEALQVDIQSKITTNVQQSVAMDSSDAKDFDYGGENKRIDPNIATGQFQYQVYETYLPA